MGEGRRTRAGRSADAEAPPPRPEGAETAPAARGTVLVADDDAEVREWLALVLVRAGFGVVEASDGLEAIEAFRAGVDRIRLVMVDRAMPRGNGPEAIDGIRRIRPDVPVVVVSGTSEESTRRAFAGRRVEAVLRKPLPLETLLVTVETLLDG